MIILQLCVILTCLLLGTRFSGISLGLISGIGLFLLTFLFGLAPGKPPVDVMLTILAVISCAAVLQAADGLKVMLKVAETVLRRHPSYITLFAPLATWTLTVLCGTGHVVYTMFPIIYDIAIKQGIRPERPMAVASVASQIGISASPVSVAVVSMASILAAGATGHAFGIVDLLSIALPSTLIGVLAAALWSMRRGKPLEHDPAFQKKLQNPAMRTYIYGDSEQSLLGQSLPSTSYKAAVFFFMTIFAVVLFGSFPEFRPVFALDGQMKPVSMTLVIQIFMLVAGAVILIGCRVKSAAVAEGTIFKAGMSAIVSVYGVAWMADTFFSAHFQLLEYRLTDLVAGYPIFYALALFLVSKLVNSQAAAIAAVAPMGLAIGIDPKMIIAFFPACYGYFVLPTYPSDLACIGFDRSGTTKIGKYILNHSFIVPGFIGVGVSCLVGFFLTQLFY